MKWILVAAMIVTSTAGMTAHAKKTVSRSIASEKSSLTDTVKKIRDDDDGVVILFSKAAGSYYLRRDVAEFDALRKKLEGSLSSKKPVSVTFDGEQLNILEVK